MLLLSRKKGERITIGDNTTIVVTRITSNRVVIGIEAPADVRISRDDAKNRETITRSKNPSQESTGTLNRQVLTEQIEIESPAFPLEHPAEAGSLRISGAVFLARRARLAAERQRGESAAATCEPVAAVVATV